MSEKFHCYFCARFCVYLGPEFVKIRLTLDLNSALDSIDRGQDLFRKHRIIHDFIKFLESLIIYSGPKCLAHPSRWISGLSVYGSFHIFVILEEI